MLWGTCHKNTLATGVDERIILIWLLEEWDMKLEIELYWLIIGSSGRFFHHGDGLSGYIRCMERLDELSNSQLFVESQPL
jgi:hypothetical protein